MNRKLLLLDFVLLAVVVYAGMQFRELYKKAKEREAAQRNVLIRPVAQPPAQSVPTAPPVMATTYAPIAQKLLMDPSRNPDIPIEEPPAPPPPPPMPALPIYHGMLNLGDEEGAFAIMSPAANKPNKQIHPGEMIGEFKLLAVSRDGIDLQWRDKTVHKSLEEATDHSHPAYQAPAAPAIVGGYASEPVAPPPPPTPAAYGPGAGDGPARACVVNDTTPNGAVRDGYRKIVKPGPFGQTCYWEAVH